MIDVLVLGFVIYNLTFKEITTKPKLTLNIYQDKYGYYQDKNEEGFYATAYHFNTTTKTIKSYTLDKWKPENILYKENMNKE